MHYKYTDPQGSLDLKQSQGEFLFTSPAQKKIKNDIGCLDFKTKTYILEKLHQKCRLTSATSVHGTGAGNWYEVLFHPDDIKIAPSSSVTALWWIESYKLPAVAKITCDSFSTPQSMIQLCVYMTVTAVTTTEKRHNQIC